MPDWRDEYLVNLREAESRNPVNSDLVAACSQLADRVAALEAEKALLQKDGPSSITTTPAPPGTASPPLPPASEPTPPVPGATTAGPSDPSNPQLKLEIAELVRSKGALQHKHKLTSDDLARLRTKARVDEKRIADLTSERNALTLRLKDRNEELVGKTKMLKDVQDENLTLNMELDVMEKNVSKVRAENKELVDRWMKRMAQEADAMNLANEPVGRKGR